MSNRGRERYRRGLEEPKQVEQPRVLPPMRYAPDVKTPQNNVARQPSQVQPNEPNAMDRITNAFMSAPQHAGDTFMKGAGQMGDNDLAGILNMALGGVHTAISPVTGAFAAGTQAIREVAGDDTGDILDMIFNAPNIAAAELDKTGLIPTDKELVNSIAQTFKLKPNDVRKVLEPLKETAQFGNQALMFGGIHKGVKSAKGKPLLENVPKRKAVKSDFEDIPKQEILKSEKIEKQQVGDKIELPKDSKITEEILNEKPRQQPLKTEEVVADKVVQKVKKTEPKTDKGVSKPVETNTNAVKNLLERGKDDKQVKKALNIKEKELTEIKKVIPRETEKHITELPREDMPKVVSEKVLTEAKDIKAELKAPSVERGGSYYNEFEGKAVSGNYTVNTFPEWFKDIGRSKKEVMGAIEKIIIDKGKDKGKLVSEVKQIILDNLKFGKRSVETHINKGKTKVHELGKKLPDAELNEFLDKVKTDKITLEDFKKLGKEFDGETSFEFGANAKEIELLPKTDKKLSRVELQERFDLFSSRAVRVDGKVFEINAKDHKPATRLAGEKLGNDVVNKAVLDGKFETGSMVEGKFTPSEKANSYSKNIQSKKQVSKKAQPSKTIIKTEAGEQPFLSSEMAKPEALRPKKVGKDIGEKGSPLFEQKKVDKAQIDFVAEARSNIKAKQLGRTNAGFDPTLLKDFAVIGRSYIQKGIAKFKDWAKKMIGEFGNGIKPGLRKIWGKMHDADFRVQEMGSKKSTTKGYNTDTMHPGVKELIPDLIEQVRTDFDIQRGARLTAKQMVERGLEFAKKLKDEDVLSLERGETRNATEITGYRIYAENKFLETVDKVDLSKPLQSVKGMERALKIYTNTRGLLTEAGRAVQSGSIKITDAEINGLRKLTELITKIDKKKGAELKNLLENTDFKLPNTKDKALFVFYNSILSNPFTDVANIVGNFSHLGFEVTARTLTQTPSSTVAMVRGLKKGVSKGLSDASKVYKGEAEMVSKFISSRDVGRFDLKPKTGIGRLMRGSLPTTRLAMEDAFFRGLASEMELAVGVKKLSKKFKESRKTVEKNIADVLKNPDLLDPKSLEYRKMLEHVDSYTDYMVFQTPLKGTISKGIQKSIAIKPIIPFAKTPANIMKVGLKTTPLGLMKLFGKHAKEIHPMEKAAITRRAVAGSVMLTALGYYVGEGKIEVTGTGPKNRRQREMWNTLGYKPNHIYLRGGDELKGISYQNINPMNIPLALVGNYMDNLKFNRGFEKENIGFGERASEALSGMASTISDQSYLQGISRFFDWMETGNPNYLKDMATQPFIPNIVSFPKNIQQYMSGEKPIYKANDVWDRVKRRAGLYDGLTPMYNVLGGQKQSGYERFPLPFSTVGADKLAKLMLKRELTISFPSSLTKIGNRRMTENEFSEYVKKSGIRIESQLNKQIGRLAKLTAEKAQDLINKIVKRERKATKSTFKGNTVVGGRAKSKKYKRRRH